MRIMLEVESASQEALKYRLPCFIIQSASSRTNPYILTHNNPIRQLGDSWKTKISQLQDDRSFKTIGHDSRAGETRDSWMLLIND
jgi:hypothetical protein